MIKIIKKYIRKTLETFGIEVRIKSKFSKVMNYDDIYRSKILSDKPTIIDVGANKGQSIDRFCKIFKLPEIFAFEPNPEVFKVALDKYKNFKNIRFNNQGIAKNDCIIPLNVTINTGNSSFHGLRKDSEWMKIRSKQFNTTPDNYITETVEVKCTSLDKYCELNKIENIDILKIDTQGYEDEVLSGATHLIKNKKIKFIEVEIMFDEVYTKTMSFFDIEDKLMNNYKLYGIDYQEFKNLSEGYMFAVDALYIRK